MALNNVAEKWVFVHFKAYETLESYSANIRSSNQPHITILLTQETLWDRIGTALDLFGLSVTSPEINQE